VNDAPAQMPVLLALITTAGIAVLFGAAGIAKLRHRALLPGVIANYRLLPAGLVAPAAMLLAPVELLVAAAMLAGVAPWAQAMAAALLLLFAAAMAINVMRGRRHIDCGCGHAALRQPLGWGVVVRNIVLATAVLVAGLVLADAGASVDAASRALAAIGGLALYGVTELWAGVHALGRSARASGLAARR
jgi:hypothetical protein